MAEPDVLTHAFLAAHPQDAARVLEQLPSDDAAALFDSAPARLCAPVLGAMLPYPASRCLQRVDATRAPLLLSGISVPAAAAILRHLPEAQRIPLLDALPTPAALACRALLGYPEDSVGAFVDTEIVALTAEHRVRDAQDALGAARVTPSGPVYVIDAQRRPVGQVDLAVLLRAAPHDRLDRVMGAIPATLPAVTPLEGSADHPLWRLADVVPVVERSGALVGVVRRRALLAAQRRFGAGAAPASGSLAGVLATGYWHWVTSLMEATLSMLAASGRHRP
ncbi:MAG: hypothetical protein ABI812_05430 [Betaproteobacteria bacterium]